jgi:hypothetical protein
MPVIQDGHARIFGRVLISCGFCNRLVSALLPKAALHQTLR